MGPIILRRIFGVNPIFTRPENGPTLFLVGSIARFATPLSTIWGSGAASIADQINPSARILAVRGPLTAKIVARDGGKAPQAMGDPGILLRELHRDIRTARSAKYGLIPHVAHEATLRSRHAKQLDNFDIISMQAEGESGVRHIVEQIANCEFVFSTSLHGFIVAHALGVRAAPVFAPGPFQIISGFDFKFRDYCASVGITFEFLDLRDVLSNPGNAANKCSLPGDKILDSHCDALRTAMNEYLSTVRNQF